MDKKHEKEFWLDPYDIQKFAQSCKDFHFKIVKNCVFFLTQAFI